MASAAPKPKYVVNESGKKTEVVLSMKSYKQLLAAWEEVADAEDYENARRTAKKFIDTKELRKRVFHNK